MKSAAPTSFASVWSPPSLHCEAGFLITRPRRPYCASKSTVHTDTFTESDSADISLVISHPKSHFGRSERKLAGLSGWIIPGDWLTGNGKLMNLWQGGDIGTTGFLWGKKRIKKEELMKCDEMPTSITTLYTLSIHDVVKCKLLLNANSSLANCMAAT